MTGERVSYRDRKSGGHSLGYWDVLPASADNLRLFNQAKSWVQFADQVDGDGKPISFGANRDIDLALSVAMNASNLMVLTGAGASHRHRPNEKDTDRFA
jgi:hypothetical protein